MNSSPKESADELTIETKRDLVRPLLAPSEPGDAMTAYYALLHDAKRVRLTLGTTPTGRVDRFAAVCQTGRDLFVPLVVLRAPQEGVGDLLHKALEVGRPYTIITKPAFRDEIAEVVLLQHQQINAVHILDPSAYRPIINVMVQPGEGPFRFEIRIDDVVVAAAGVNWRSRRLADMYVYTDSQFAGRGWGKAVGAACVKVLLEAHLVPLYTAALENAASMRLAEALGFRDSEARELECRGRLRQIDPLAPRVPR